MNGSSGGSDKWDRRFLEMAGLVADWSKDPSTKVGAVIVRPDRTVASVGFNGFPRGVLDHEDRYGDRSTKYEMCVHAELNALLNSRESLENCTLYVTPLPPCAQCAAAMIQRGITKVVAAVKPEIPEIWREKFEISKTMFAEARVLVCEVPMAPAANGATPKLPVAKPQKAARRAGRNGVQARAVHSPSR